MGSYNTSAVQRVLAFYPFTDNKVCTSTASRTVGQIPDDRVRHTIRCDRAERMMQ
jgi:hypothetical protein